MKQAELTALKIIWRGWLMDWFKSNGIVRCEWRDCSNPIGLAGAHRVKQRYIRTWDEARKAAYLCVSHHHYIEYGDRKHRGTHRRMSRFVMVFIRRRGMPSLDLDSTRRSARRPNQRSEPTQEHMNETIIENGTKYRRSSVKTRDKAKLKQKVEEFEARGETTLVKEAAGISYIYLKKEKAL